MRGTKLRVVDWFLATFRGFTKIKGTSLLSSIIGTIILTGRKSPDTKLTKFF